MWRGGHTTKRQLVDLRHERAMDIADEDVTQVSETQWHVRSSQGAGDPGGRGGRGGGGGRGGRAGGRSGRGGRGGYDVSLESAQCLNNNCHGWDRCFAKGCDGLCGHMYRCTCLDDNTLCKHVHKVRTLSVRSTQTAAQQAATRSADQLWRREVGVERQVRKVRGTLMEICHYLDRFDLDALQGVIGDAAEKLAAIAATIHSHCEYFEEIGEEADHDDD